MLRTYTPKLPPHWEPLPGVQASIPIEENLTWDEDLYDARWKGWGIWIDGGKGITAWQVALVITEEPNEDGILERDHQRVMRDFLDTPEQVQAWIDRAVKVAARWDAEEDRKAAKVKP